MVVAKLVSMSAAAPHVQGCCWHGCSTVSQPNTAGFPFIGNQLSAIALVARIVIRKVNGCSAACYIPSLALVWQLGRA